MFFGIFFTEKFALCWINVYLCIRFWERTLLVMRQKSKKADKERVLWKDYNKQRNSSTRSGFHWDTYLICIFDGIREGKLPVNKDKEGILKQSKVLMNLSVHKKSNKDILQWRVWSWLRMNASYRLNTCKSRGSMKFACKLWWRPAHGWVTRIQPAPYHGIARRKAD